MSLAWRGLPWDTRAREGRGAHKSSKFKNGCVMCCFASWVSGPDRRPKVSGQSEPYRAPNRFEREAVASTILLLAWSIDSPRCARKHCTQTIYMFVGAELRALSHRDMDMIGLLANVLQILATFAPRQVCPLIGRHSVFLPRWAEHL